MKSINAIDAEKLLVPKLFHPVAKQLRTQMNKALKQSVDYVLQETLPITPKQYGGLRQSGRTQLVKKDKYYIEYSVDFGGRYQVTPTPNAPEGVVFYAAEVYLTPIPPERRTTPGTLDHYLLHGWNRSQQWVYKKVPDTVKEVFK